MWDLPGGRYDVENLDNLDLQRVGACIFVIDAQVCTYPLAAGEIHTDCPNKTRPSKATILTKHEGSYSPVQMPKQSWEYRM